LFESLSREEFNGLRPARDYIRSPTGKANILSYESNRYVAGMITKGHYWVYTGYGDALNLDLAGISEDWGYPTDQLQVGWFDPRTSHTHKVDSRIFGTSKGEATFTPPSSGGVDHDWVLAIKLTSNSC
jgi:hypothetical protein